MRHRSGGMLEYLVSGYFHEDFDLEADAPLGVVEKFAHNEVGAFCDALIEELNIIQSRGLSDSDLKKIWLEDLQSSYDPEVDGITYSRWFAQMITVLSGRHS
ncbi:contact-dependent growth inhibition system immunity protein [Amycolatopsis pithecellobii]|uniref:contact-dependent growth inhibition system immunity protein n=1 Tax=Amycolatopsis pithecellobii TaxID=664692 RepID=UPI0035E46254